MDELSAFPQDEKPIAQNQPVQSEYDEPLAPGQLFIDRDGRILRISEIEGNKVRTQIRHGQEWSSYGECEPDQFNNTSYYGYIRITGTPQEEIEKAINLFKSGCADQENQEGINADEQTTALAQAATKNTLLGMIATTNKIVLDVERAKRAMMIMTNRMDQSLRVLQAKVSRLQKVISLLELYAGVYEEITQFKFGEKAPVDTPISIRQMVLFADEEFGDPRHNRETGQPGLDWQNIERLDEWLLDEKNLNKVLPEQKGIVAIKPSRQKRRYSDDPMVNQFLSANNKMTYLLIRNGENLTRIYTNVVFDNLLFPTKEISEKIYQNTLKRDFIFSDNYENLDTTYRRQALIIQGILDRSDLLQPLPHPINLFKPETYGTALRFVRDAEYTLEDGHERFKDWQMRTNVYINEGSLVLLSPALYLNHRSRDFSGRFLHNYREYNTPPLPRPGIYIVEKTEPIRLSYYDREKRPRLKIMYNPNDVVDRVGWSWEPHPRKNRLSFVIDPEDDFVLNYAHISLEIIDYYLNNRLDRGSYLDTIPLLWELRDQLAEEYKRERHFCNQMVAMTGAGEKAVWDAIKWWKEKTNYQRRIDDRDHDNYQKAYRMILKRLKSAGSAGH